MTRKVVNFPQEWVAGFTRNQWQVCSGMGGRFGQESAPGDRDEDDEGKKDDTRVEKPADDKSRDSEKGDDKAKEEKSGDNEGKDQKRVDGERKDGKPGDDKPSDRRSDDRESGDYKPGDNGPGDDGPGNDRREDYGPGDNGPGDDRRGDYGPGDDGRGDYGPPPPGDYGPDDYQGEGPPPTGGDYGPYGPPPPGGEYGPSEYGPSGDMSGNPGPGDYGPSGDMRGDFGPYGPPSQGGDYGPYGPPPPGGDFGFYGPPPPGGFYGGPGDFGPGGFGPGDFNMGDFGPGDFYMGDFGPGDFFHPDIGFDISDYLIKPFSVDSIGISGNSGDSHFSLSMSGKYNQTPPFMYMYENIRGALTGSLKSGYFYGFTACGWNPSGQTVDGTAAFFYIGSDESGGMMGGDVSGSYSTDLHDWNASSSLDWVQLSDPGSLIVPGSVAGITDYARDIFIVTGSGSGNFYQSNTDIGDFNIYKSDGIFDSIQEDQYWGFWQTHTGSTYLTIAGKTLVDCDDWFLEWEQKGWETTDPAETQNLYLYMSAKGTIPNYKRVESTDVAGGWVDIKHAVTGIAIGELDGGYNPSESEIFAGGGGVWLETSQLLTKASTAGGRADLVKLDIPSVTVGTANLAYNNPGGAIITNVTLTGVTFLSYASDQAPRLWATGTVTGTNVAAPTAGTTTVNLSGNNYSAGASALIAKFNVTAWDTSENPDKWTATITDGTGTVNSKSITFKGGAGGEIDSPTAFSGTAAGWAK